MKEGASPAATEGKAEGEERIHVRSLELTSQRLGIVAKLDLAEFVSEDHVMIIGVGSAENVAPRIDCLGKRSFERIERAPVIV